MLIKSLLIALLGKRAMTNHIDNLNLIESWLSVVLIPGMTTAQAIRDLNDDLGTRYTPQDFGKWRRADRPLPQPVQNYMMRCSISFVMSSEGINTLTLSDDALDRIADRLTPPK